jgi:hypothetical protein
MSNLGSALNLQQALNYQPNGGVAGGTSTPTTGGGYGGVLTPSGQGGGNAWYNPTTIGANGNAVAMNPSSQYAGNQFMPQQFGGGLSGMRYDPLTGQWIY